MRNLEEHISKFSNIDIRDNIISLNKKQLKLIKESSYLNAFNVINTLKSELKNNKQNENIGLMSEMSLLDHYINKTINLLDDSIHHESDERIELQLKEAMVIREELYELSSIIEGYSIELGYVGELVDQYGTKILSKQNYENVPYSINKVEDLIILVNEVLDKVKEDYYKYIYIISQIISILPMRLVKDNYFTIVKNTITRNFKLYNKVQVENQINEYKKIFDSSIRDGYGTRFDYYFREIQKLRNINLSDKDLDGLDDIVKEIMKLTKEINEIFNFILRLGLLSNMIIVINLIDRIPITEEVEKIYYNWIKNIWNQDMEKSDELNVTIEKKIKEIEEEIFKDLEEFNLLNSEALKREDFNYDDLNEELLYTKKILTYYNDANLIEQNLLFSEDDSLITQEYLEQIIDSLIQYINRSLSKMNNIERKVRMRKLLSQIELPFNGIEEFNKYIKYSLDNRVLPKEEISFTIDYLLYFLEDIINGK